MTLISILRKYSAVMLIQLKNNWVREAVYRTNFITNIFVDLIWIIVEFSLFTVIYANVPTLAGWSKPQVFFFLGVLFSADAIFTIFFTRNMWLFSDLVNKGELDILLTKPISTLFLALTRWINLTAVTNFALGVFIMVKYAGPAGFAGGWQWLRVPGWLLFGVSMALLLRMMFSISVFWTERSWALARLYYQFYSFATKPDAIYPVIIRNVIRTILPYALIGSVPARALLYGLSNAEWLMLFSVFSCFFVANICLWRSGLRRYQSASS